jgi:hypothetical protein
MLETTTGFSIRIAPDKFSMQLTKNDLVGSNLQSPVNWPRLAIYDLQTGEK